MALHIGQWCQHELIWHGGAADKGDFFGHTLLPKLSAPCQMAGST